MSEARMSEKVLELIAYVMTALSKYTLYSKEHPAIRSISEKAVDLLKELYREEKFSLAVLGENLVVNDAPFALKSIHLNSFMNRLLRNGIDKIVITEGATAGEIQGFISELARNEGISGTYPHIATGIVEVKTKSDHLALSAMMDENRSRVKETFQGVSRSRTLDMRELENSVLSFISTLRQGINVLRLISPVKSHSEYTFAHATNVAVLSLFQAESLGLKGELLHDICIAGLLHDIGKIFVSVELIDKQTKLDETEWGKMKSHPFYGALYLSKLPDTPKIAVIAAYEHHMRFDGKGYPDTKKRNKKQHIISQIIAVSDFFDALRTERSYRKALEVPVITGIMKEAAGKDLNPVLVENFFRVLVKNT
jgi:HD-GYP domain-containing protein (c-di-GMP phosphodiesterase class II)